MARFWIEIPIEARDVDDAWEQFWNMVADGPTDAWDALDIEARKV